ncbi:ABC transporter ATP-binding protein [Litorihabitans aurantiacus]|uniref:ABC transporter ATP-binding protein n=1 Tax=Litorihabitans aurantiacus TaxID=1930061 RepID=UPI0024E16A91|nr:ABC transporter ATP-binding protein [Litorihabitans aurantiacus]
MLTLSGISHSYRRRPVLAGLDLDVGPGITALLGVNGAGKSTLFRIAAGALRPDQGEVRISGSAINSRRERGRALRHLALMPQSSSFPGNLTAREIVRYVAWMRGAKSRDCRDLAEAALHRVGLAEEADTPFRRLSGGMRRRVALAQAVSTSPDLLLLDEPCTGLDPAQRHTMVDLVRGLGGAVVLSSHVMEDVRDLADRVIVLHDRLIRFDGSVADLEARAPRGSSRAAEAGFLGVIQTGSS